MSISFLRSAFFDSSEFIEISCNNVSEFSSSMASNFLKLSGALFALISSASSWHDVCKISSYTFSIWLSVTSIPPSSTFLFSISSFISFTCFLASIPLYPACRIVAAFSASALSMPSIIVFVSFSSTFPLCKFSIFIASSSRTSAFILATCFLASIPRNPDWIRVAAFSTSGSSKSISIFCSSWLDCNLSCFGSWSSISVIFVFVGSFCFPAFISATCFLASMPL